MFTTISKTLESLQSWSKTITSVFISICVLMSSAWIVKLIVANQPVVIERIEMPATLEELGLRGDIVVQRVLDQLDLLKTVAVIDKSESAIFRAVAAKPEIKIEATVVGGLPVKSIEQGLNFVLGKRVKTITGEITRKPTADERDQQFEGRLRVDNKVISKRTVNLKTDDLDTLVKQLSFDLYAHFEPFRAALAAWRLGDYEMARDVLRPLVVSANSEDRKYSLWLRSKLASARQEETDLMEALSIDPNFHMALVSLSDVYRRRKDFDGGVAFADQAIAAAPESPLGYHEKGRNLREANRTAEAIVAYRTACSRSVPYAPCHNQLGEIFMEQGSVLIDESGRLSAQGVDKYRQAQTEFIKAIKVDPVHVWAHSNGAYVATALGDHREGLILANRAKSLDPKAPAHQLRYAWALLRSGNKSDARAILDEIVSKQPEWAANPMGGWGNRFILRQLAN